MTAKLPGDVSARRQRATLGAAGALPALERLKRDGWQLGEPRPSVPDDALRACATANH